MGSPRRTPGTGVYQDGEAEASVLMLRVVQREGNPEFWKSAGGPLPGQQRRDTQSPETTCQPVRRWSAERRDRCSQGAHFQTSGELPRRETPSTLPEEAHRIPDTPPKPPNCPAGRRLAAAPGLALLVFEQMEHFGANLRWIGIPTLVPVTINLPTDLGQPMAVRGTPLANLGMCLAETPIRTEVTGGCDTTGRQLGNMNSVAPGERPRDLHSHLNTTRTQIQSDVASQMRESGRAKKRPHLAARCRNELRQLLRRHVPPDDGGRNRVHVRQCNLVEHA